MAFGIIGQIGRSIFKTATKSIPKGTDPIFRYGAKPMSVIDKIRPVRSVLHKRWKGFDEIADPVTGMTYNKGDDLARMLQDSVERINLKEGSLRVPFTGFAKKMEKRLGPDGFHHMVYGAGYRDISRRNPAIAYKNTKEYQKFWGGLDDATRNDVLKFEELYSGTMDDYFLKRGKDIGVLGKGIRPGSYVPEAMADRYNVFVLKNADEINKIGREVSVDDFMSKGMESRFATSDYASAKDFIASNGLHGKSVIFSEGFVPSGIHQAMKHKKVAEWMKEISEKGSKALLDDPKTSEEIRSLILKEMGGGGKAAGLHTFSPNTMYWRGINKAKAGFRVNADMLDNYTHTMIRKIEMEDSLKAFREAYKHPVYTNNPSLRQYTDDIFDRVFGRPPESLQWLSRHTRKVGIDEQHLTKFFSTMMQVEAALKIGLNPLLPLVNMTQVWMNTSALLGPQYVGRAYVMAATKQGRQLIRDAGYTSAVAGRDMPKLLEGMSGLKTSSIMENINSVVLKPFSMVEMRHNRGISYLAGRIKAESLGSRLKLLPGETRLQAIDRYGKEVVTKTQFPYGTASQPWIFSSPFTRVAGQFKNYFINQMDFVEQLGRMAAKGAATGDIAATYPFLRLMGGYGIIGGLSSVPFMSYFEERSAELNKLAVKYPTLFRGVPGLAGIDISRRIDLQFPDSRGDWIRFLLGPTYGDVTKLAQAAPEMVKGQFGEKSMRFVRGLSPAASSFLGIAKDSQGYASVDSGGRVIARYKTPREAILKALGFRTTAGFKQEKARHAIRIITKRYRDSRSYYINKIAKAVNEGDFAEAERLRSYANKRKVAGTPFLSHNITRSDINIAKDRMQQELSKKGMSEEKRKEILGYAYMSSEG